MLVAETLRFQDLFSIIIIFLPCNHLVTNQFSSYPIFLNFGMGDEGTSTHVLAEHGKAENELEELQLTKSDKSKQKSSKTKASSQDVKRREPAKRFHVEENQSLDVVKSFAESISANFAFLTESMTNSFQKLGIRI